MDQAVILSAVRTPIGKFQGGLAPLSAPQLGAKVVAETVRRAGIEPKSVDEVIMGNVVQAGLGQNPARQAGLGGGLDVRVAAMTVNKVCGSGLKAVGLAAHSVILGEAEIVVAGGMESMSNCPYLLPGARTGYRFGNAEVVDSMVHDGLWDVYNDFHMGITAELVAEKYGITRQEQDQFALESHQRAVRARKSCFIESQIVPVEIPQKKGDPVIIKYDESPREDASLEALGKLRPAFKKDGTVTAGRVDPKWIMEAPIYAVEKLLEKTGWDRDRDLDLVELNEAFAVAAIAVTRQLRLNPAKVNVNGGAVALGHPIGASGARILTTLLYEMQRRNVHRGIAALCLGGGNAVAMAVER